MDDITDTLCSLEYGGSKTDRASAIPNGSAALFGV